MRLGSLSRGSGEYTHQNWLENWHWDTGAISTAAMNDTTATKPAPAPAPALPPKPAKPAASVPGPGYMFPLPTGYYFGPSSGGAAAPGRRRGRGAPHSRT